ncbi:hypothetical protein M3P36_07280 [Altererythrobacter sp. KTW20L]|nr:hypothetical protein [Altererythrobacter sp. KTW20L]MCL6250842.1 hypothetical protein [Altererythrobacter sp. KTW20L]
MHANLELSVELCEDPDARETELVNQFAPPLNLTKCEQTPQHRMIADARRVIFAKLQGAAGGFASPSDVLRSNGFGQQAPMPPSDRSLALRRPIGAEIDTAEAIALRYGLNAKSYRHGLRGNISWYQKPQDWTFRVGSREWQDMIEVAEMMAARG